MNRLHLALSVLMATPFLAAQAGGTPDESVTVERRAKEMRESLESQKPIRSHVRVEVKLQNGNKLQGIVKDGRLVERVDGLRFVDAHADDKGAGIRLWYSGGASNYVFVPFADFAQYKVLQRLSAKELTEIEDRMRMEEAAAAEKRRQLDAERKAREAADAKAAAEAEAEGETTDDGEAAVDGDGKPTAKGKPVKGGKDKDGKDVATPKVTGEQQQQRDWFQLLQEYPPAEGWNAAKKDEIGRRLAVVGAKPSDKEQRFVDKFEDWKKACAHFAVDPEQGNEKVQQANEAAKKRKKG